MRPKKNIPWDCIVEEWIEGATVSSLGKKYEISRTTINAYLTSNNIEHLLDDEAKERYKYRVTTMEQVIGRIDGTKLLLEDAHAEMRKRNFQFHMCLKHLQECQEVLGNFYLDHKVQTRRDLRKLYEKR